MEITELKKNMKALQDNIEKVIVGKRSVIELVLTALLAKGNLLLEENLSVYSLRQIYYLRM